MWIVCMFMDSKGMFGFVHVHGVYLSMFLEDLIAMSHGKTVCVGFRGSSPRLALLTVGEILQFSRLIEYFTTKSGNCLLYNLIARGWIWIIISTSWEQGWYTKVASSVATYSSCLDHWNSQTRVFAKITHTSEDVMATWVSWAHPGHWRGGSPGHNGFQYTVMVIHDLDGANPPWLWTPPNFHKPHIVGYIPILYVHR